MLSVYLYGKSNELEKETAKELVKMNRINMGIDGAGGYLFEGAAHWLVGTSRNNELNELWRDIGALSDNVKAFNV